ncbi:MAG: hypothetical protein HXY25_10135 [Alphaproteobacteria bacterium]|nr:hypothetical protein [Alphaproteobacteria bacterium]
MSHAELTAELARLTAARRVTPDDVRRLRGLVYGDAEASLTEAATLLAIDAGLSERCRPWTDFLAEAVTDLLVRQEMPAGYVTQEKADWLVDHISVDGVVQQDSELHVLVHVLEAADEAPAELAAFALRQVAAAVIHGSGPLACGGRLEPGHVTADEVALIRRILYAGGSEHGLSVSRAEAEVLLAIDAATAEADNDPAWTTLFSNGLAAALMAPRAFTPPPRAEALRQEGWLADTSVNPGRFLGRAFGGGLSFLTGRRGAALEDPFEVRAAEMTRARAEAEVITEAEADWLLEQLPLDRPLSPAAEALLARLKAEAPVMPERLHRLVNARAA